MNAEDCTRESSWFAIRTRQDFKAAEVLSTQVDDILFPKTRIKLSNGKSVERALIPHVLFIKTTSEKALDLEKVGRESRESNLPFWIYRYPKSQQIQEIPAKSIHLLRLLSSGDTSTFEIYNKESFTAGQRVRITGGVFKGYEGFVKRIHKDRRVLVSIESVCMVLLPFIHPDLLERLPPPQIAMLNPKSHCPGSEV